MDRAYLGQYLTGQYAPLLATAGLTNASDSPGGFGPALDSVFRQLSIDPLGAVDPAVPPGLEQDAILLTRYYTLDWILASLANDVDVRTADQSEMQSQRFKQVQALLARALEQIPNTYNVVPGDFAYGRLQVDFLEPIFATGAGSPFLYP